MKRIVLLLVTCFCAMFSWSQGPYLPFVEEGKTWVIRQEMPPHPDTLTFVLRGDTIVGEITAKKLYAHSKGVYGGRTSYQGALFEEGGKVMCIPRNADKPYLLYQFAEPGTDLGKHPAISLGDVYDDIVYRLKSDSWDYVENCGVRRIVQKVSFVQIGENDENGYDRGLDEWIEGIGYHYGPSCMTVMRMTGTYGSRILSVSVGDRVLYNVTGVAPLLAEPAEGEVLHDLDGRRLTTPPQHGVYLRNGKKVVR